MLFDSAFAKPPTFKKLNQKANLAHVRHTFNLSPTTEDKDIYQLATQERRLIITIDDDFKNLVRPGKAGVIFISPYLSNSDIDKSIYKFIRDKNPDDFWGKITKA